MSALLVSPEWLKDHLGDPEVKVVDASWYLPAQNRDAKAEFLAGHIPGAVFFDIDAIADHSTDLPHMLPDAAAFGAAAGALGLSESDTIIVYDGLGLFSAPRVWWTLKIFGAKDVRVLDGGLPAWDKAGYPKEAGEAKPRPARFAAALAKDRVRDFDEVRAALAARRDRARCALRAALPGRAAGAASRPPLRPYAGRAESPLRKTRRRRPARATGKNPRAFPGGKGRSLIPRDNHLRVGDHGGGAALRAGATSARRTSPSTTAPGPIGARAPARRSPRGRHEGENPRNDGDLPGDGCPAGAPRRRCPRRRVSP